MLERQTVCDSGDIRCLYTYCLEPSPELVLEFRLARLCTSDDETLTWSETYMTGVSKYYWGSIGALLVNGSVAILGKVSGGYIRGG